MSTPRSRLRAAALAVVTNGRRNQSFLGARWIALLLRLAPPRARPALALYALALSPHYFEPAATPRAAGQRSRRAWLVHEYKRIRFSRQAICALVIAPHLTPQSRVLDIGCGPGFLARAMAARAGHVYACDISAGALECARILNSAANITYFNTGDDGFAPVADASIDLAVSFAVIQHLREAEIRSIFAAVAATLRPGGRALLQVQLDDGTWDSEEERVRDRSLPARLRLRYGLNFFSRPLAFFHGLARRQGLQVEAVRPMAEILRTPFDSTYYQHLLEIYKPL